MASVATTVRGAIGVVSPRRRRYRRMLGSCALDPASLPQPLDPTGPHDVVICGCPRSGTALLTAALHQPPTMVTVMEPWDGLRMAPAELFASLRREMAGGGLARGRLDLDALEASGAVDWTGEGDGRYAVDTRPDSLVGVKWPTFWQYLPLLPTTRFLVCVRHPADVIDSFATQSGRLRRGFDYDVAFNRRLNDELALIESPEARRLALYDRIYSTVLDHIDRPEIQLVRYEDWHRDTGSVLAGISDFLGRDLTHNPAAVAGPAPITDLDRRQAIVDRSTTARTLGY